MTWKAELTVGIPECYAILKDGVTIGHIDGAKNALLAVTAEDLLEACQAALDTIRTLKRSIDDDEHLIAVALHLATAIGKAEGR